LTLSEFNQRSANGACDLVFTARYVGGSPALRPESRTVIGGVATCTGARFFVFVNRACNQRRLLAAVASYNLHRHGELGQWVGGINIW